MPLTNFQLPPLQPQIPLFVLLVSIKQMENQYFSVVKDQELIMSKEKRKLYSVCHHYGHILSHVSIMIHSVYVGHMTQKLWYRYNMTKDYIIVI